MTIGNFLGEKRCVQRAVEHLAAPSEDPLPRTDQPRPNGTYADART
jgi:hypothetical protein